MTKKTTTIPPKDWFSRLEKIPVEIYGDSTAASKRVAETIAGLIRKTAAGKKPCVLGLATGSTPLMVYRELVRMHREEGLSFRNVVSFNLDEYWPMEPESVHSYYHFMHENLFGQVDIDPANIHIPDGMVSKEQLFEYCAGYDRKIEALGGIDLQILGIGRTGHIGFNEPGSAIDSPTRIMTLDHLTRMDAASDFMGMEYVPLKAITMGVQTILRSKKILLLAWGEGKSAVIKKAIEEEVSSQVPASYLQKHPDVTVFLDPSAAAELTREHSPWLLGPCEWNEYLTRKAVIWLCSRVQKPILKLTDRDYMDHGMTDLVTDHGPSNKINIAVFNHLQHTITGWPGGKPDVDDSTRPERALPYPKKVLVFSPHPDDDMISMGGTVARLAEQGHEVHTVYMTSGNVAVSDDDVLRFLEFVHDFSAFSHDPSAITGKTIEGIRHDLAHKQPGFRDSMAVRRIKGLIRQGEARSACRVCGIPPRNIHFLELPFYDSGLITQRYITGEDVKIVHRLLDEMKPHQVFAAGDLSDPHGTHRLCMKAIQEAFGLLEGEPWLDQCRVWLYRGAWQEWEPENIEMAVPLSPEEAEIKRNAIFRHQSQKDRPLFPGIDTREFWQRAEDRNRFTAELFDRLGMAEYQALELFRRMR